MKWPIEINLIRHDTSAYNVLRDLKKKDELYIEFLAARKKDPLSEVSQALARQVWKKYALNTSDAATKLADPEGKQAYTVGLHLSKTKETPDVIFVSPYDRACETLRHISRGWPALKGVKTYKDERVREQQHGLALLYNDWRVFETLHPEQAMLRKIEGPYWYQYPRGESVPNVRDRNRSFVTTLIRDFNEKKVLVITHHLNILAIRANLERLDDKQFIHLDEKDKPINCGVTTYRGNPDKGKDGRLELVAYNQKFY